MSSGITWASNLYSGWLLPMSRSERPGARVGVAAHPPEEAPPHRRARQQQGQHDEHRAGNLDRLGSETAGEGPAHESDVLHPDGMPADVARQRVDRESGEESTDPE